MVDEVDETILPTRGGGMLTEGGAGEAALLRGVVWVQRERLFARWKERFCILTRDYLHCFKKGSTQLTECGPFLFKVCFKKNSDTSSCRFFIDSHSAHSCYFENSLLLFLSAAAY